MATLPKLISEIAPHDGRGEATVTQVARLLRDAGHLTKGKRGVGAAHMTSEDAAALIIGCFGAMSPKDAPAYYAQMKTLEFWYKNKDRPKRRLPEFFDSLDQGDNFQDALAGLIDAVPSIVSYFRYLAENAAIDNCNGDQEKEADVFDIFTRMILRGDLLKVEVTLKGFSAQILMIASEAGNDNVLWEATFIQSSNLFMTGFYSDERHDRRVSVTFGLPTLIAAWKALQGDILVPSEKSGEAE